ncbi:hypothetical protein LO763_22680 [Glycomyces sp. A-F 0318]|uniref:hypothetical protein n=1 Tax=Glycomyces amatae TaxID=2881355 RepID=UPI001E63B722|nr:hypothetical protein [Glycomyces amatae]MCD0446426.1 hypothetical protein [Glycomyces amatae]
MPKPSAAVAITAAVLALCPRAAHAADITGNADLTIAGTAATATVTAPAPLKSTVTITVHLTGMEDYATAATDAPECTAPAANTLVCTYADSKQDITIPVQITPAPDAHLYESETITGTLTATDATGTATLPVTVTGNRPDPADDLPTPDEPSGPLEPTPLPSPVPTEAPTEPAVTATETATVYLPDPAAPTADQGSGSALPAAGTPLPSETPTVTESDPVTWTLPSAPASTAEPVALVHASAPGGVNWWIVAGVLGAAAATAVGAGIVQRRRTAREAAAADHARDDTATEVTPTVDAEQQDATTA